MTSWVYVFSHFTPEALLVELVLIFVLTGGYAAFWVLRKRRLGAVTQTVPTGVVKVYLNELITDAENLRAQLFGLLTFGGKEAAKSTIPTVNLNTVADPTLGKKIAELEARMAEQAKSMETVLAEKARLEKALTDAKGAGAGAAAPGAPADVVQVAKLTEKVRVLEGKLAEYSVIEDDLANLKRLQQENAQLKAALSGKAAPAAAAVEGEPAISAEIAPEPDAAPAASAPTGGEFASFDGLVGQVEQSLAPEADPAPAAVLETPAAPAPAEKSDADLVAEFEKMLSG